MSSTNTNASVGLAVMRISPLHLGHCKIIDRMIKNCSTAIICVGSTNKYDEWNPWSFEHRKNMIKNVYGDRLKVIPLADINSDASTTEWCNYVLTKINKLGLPDPQHYFTGSEADSIFYQSYFCPENKRHLHIVNRNQNEYPPATDIRNMIALDDERWKQWVPAVNHALIEQTFPEEFRIAR